MVVDLSLPEDGLESGDGSAEPQSDLTERDCIGGCAVVEYRR